MVRIRRSSLPQFSVELTVGSLKSELPEIPENYYPADCLPPKGESEGLRLALRLLHQFCTNEVALQAFVPHCVTQRSMNAGRFVCNYHADKAEIAKIRDAIKLHMPKIRIASIEAEEYAHFAPNSENRDTININEIFYVRLIDQEEDETRRVYASFILAVKLAHEVGHMLEFRVGNAGKLVQVAAKPGSKKKTILGAPPAPPGTLRTEAGYAWEHRAIGGQLQHIEEPRVAWKQANALVIRSEDWDYRWMLVTPQYIKKLFSKSFWTNIKNPEEMLVDMHARQDLDVIVSHAKRAILAPSQVEEIEEESDVAEGEEEEEDYLQVHETQEEPTRKRPRLDEAADYLEVEERRGCTKYYFTEESDVAEGEEEEEDYLQVHETPRRTY